MEAVYKETTKKSTFQWQPFLRQVFVCSVSWVIYFSFGMSLGVTTVAVPQLRREANSTAAVDDEMVSWISAISGCLAVVLVFVLGLMAHYFGRKKTVLFISIMSFLGFLALYLSRNAIHLLMSQALQGSANAAVCTVPLLLLTECTYPKYRGMFLTLKSASAYWGIWMANAIGTFFNYRNIGLLGLICCTYNIIAIFFIPESLYWLASTKKYEECSKSHRWFYGVDDDSEKNLEMLITNKSTKKESNVKKQFTRFYINMVIRNISKPEIYKPICLCFLLVLMNVAFGKYICTIYSIQIIKAITNNESKAYLVMLVLDGISVLGTYGGCALAKMFNRRTHLLSTAIFSILFLYIISIYLYLVKFSYVSENTYLTIVLLTGYSLGVCGGPLILVTSIMAEMIPVRSRFLGLMLIALPPMLFQGISLKFFPLLYKLLEYEGTFVCFSVLSTILTLLVYIYLPETKDKTLHQIEHLFKSKKTKELEVVETLINDCP